MLSLTRRVGESIAIGEDVFITILFYWFFSLSPKLRATPPSWIRSFLG